MLWNSFDIEEDDISISDRQKVSVSKMDGVKVMPTSSETHG